MLQGDAGIIENEWKFAAMVLDRVCLIAFTFFTVEKMSCEQFKIYFYFCKYVLKLEFVAGPVIQANGRPTFEADI